LMRNMTLREFTPSMPAVRDAGATHPTIFVARWVM